MRYDGSNIILGLAEYSNYIEIDGVDYQLEYLDPMDHRKSWSPNGYIFKLRDMQEDCVTSVIKFCNVYKPCADYKLKRSLERFKREISVLEKLKENNLNNHIVEIFTSGEVDISNKTFVYYTMEAGSEDLTSFLKTNDITPSEKIRICADILKSIEGLHQLGIYHRDIKPGNFLMVANTWKIADLGLVGFREEDNSIIDTTYEKIGPYGYLSPEAINKSLGLNRDSTLITIDDKSDVFQLAKVIGFILKGEVLTGMIEPQDLSEEQGNCRLSTMLINAMQYAKNRRCDLSTFRKSFVESYGQEYVFS